MQTVHWKVAYHTRKPYISTIPIVLLNELLSERKSFVMREGIHPEYKKSVVTCVCGNTFVTRSTAGDLRIEICSNCHPFFTGRQKLVDSAGRVERYNKKYAKKSATPAA